MSKYDLFEEKVTEMVERFVEEYFDVDSDNAEEYEVNDEIWSDKESFGEIAYEIISEFFGTDDLQKIAFKKIKEMIVQNEEDI